ncbi:MAG: toll/interleukin-1 receptor domain-containing protein [Hyphomonadaceae bacterium]
MKVSAKLDLIDKIGRELQSRYSYEEINGYLTEFGISIGDYNGTNSKWVYSKTQLSGQKLELILQIAQDLDIQAQSDLLSQTLPANWLETDNLKLFISHISIDKDKATRLRDCLVPLGVSAFVAHEDIEPTKIWREEILKALSTMDAFLSIHTDGFSKSFWTQQEVGFAVARGVKRIAFKMGEDPTGFLSAQQALPRRNRNAEEIAACVVDLLKADELTAAFFTSDDNANRIGDEIPF